MLKESLHDLVCFMMYVGMAPVFILPQDLFGNGVGLCMKERRLCQELGLVFGWVEPFVWNPHIRKFEFKSKLCHFPALWPWARHLTFLSYNCLIFKDRYLFLFLPDKITDGIKLENACNIFGPMPYVYPVSLWLALWALSSPPLHALGEMALRASTLSINTSLDRKP